MMLTVQEQEQDQVQVQAPCLWTVKIHSNFFSTSIQSEAMLVYNYIGLNCKYSQ